MPENVQKYSDVFILLTLLNKEHWPKIFMQVGLKMLVTGTRGMETVHLISHCHAPVLLGGWR